MPISYEQDAADGVHRGGGENPRRDVWDAWRDLGWSRKPGCGIFLSPAAKTDAGRALVGSSEIWHAEPTTTITTGRRSRTIHSFVQRGPEQMGGADLARKAREGISTSGSNFRWSAALPGPAIPSKTTIDVDCQPEQEGFVMAENIPNTQTLPARSLW